MQFIASSERADGVQVEGVPVAQNGGAPANDQTAGQNTETPAAGTDNNNNPPNPAEQNNAPAGEQNKPAEQQKPNEEAKPAEQQKPVEENKQADAPPAGEQQQQKQPTAEEIEKAAEAKLLERLGLKTFDELKEKLNPPQELTPEQKKRNEDIARASIQEYGVRNLNMKPEQFVEMENVKNMTDVDLVKRDFVKGWIEENKDNPELKDKDLNVEAEYHFAEMFHLNSENASLKGTGEKLIAKTAAGIREGYKEEYESAAKQYNDYQTFRTNVAGYKGVVKNVLGSLPKEIVMDIDGENKFTFSLDKLDKKALESYLVNDDNLNYFVQKGSQEATTRLNGLISKYIALTHHDDMLATAIKTSHDVGVKKGGIGAKAPFQPEAIQTNTDTSQSDYTPEELAKIRQKLSGGIIR